METQAHVPPPAIEAHRRFAAWYAWLDKKTREETGKGLTRAELARRFGCARTHIGWLLSGERAAGLRLGLLIEEATRDWPEGPITVAEWDRTTAKPLAKRDAARLLRASGRRAAGEARR
jgi:transcriptional regulator with XRE-family HTH domain